MQQGSFRFAVYLAGALAVGTAVMAWIYDLPVRDPDSVAGPTYLRLPLIILAAIALDVIPRALWRSRRRLGQVWQAGLEVRRERWQWADLRFVLVGLTAWYVCYAAFRNLKSFVPFVNQHLWDGPMDALDRALFFGNDPATVLHSLFGTGFASDFFSFIYILWIGLVPLTLAIALVWTRDRRAGAWYVTAVAVNWVLGAITYYIVPSLGPVYSRPELFEDLRRTPNTEIADSLMRDRIEVLTNPFTTDAVQTIAAFASLHVGMMVTMVLMAYLLRLNRWVQMALWVFTLLTVLATIYLGWHFLLDAFGGIALGWAGVAIAARGTGNSMRRRAVPPHAEPAPVVEPAPVAVAVAVEAR